MNTNNNNNNQTKMQYGVWEKKGVFAMNQTLAS